MFNIIKNEVKYVIYIGVTMFFWPVVADMLGGNSLERREMLSSFNNAFRFIGVLLLLSSTFITILISYKEKKAKSILEKAISDPFWNEETLKFQTRFIFNKVNYAWENNDATPLKDYTTPEFLDSFKAILHKKQSDAKSINSIDIAEIRIVCCQDFGANDKDRYVGYISGKVNASDNDTNSGEKFSEMYHFIRNGNDSLLEKIDYEISLWNLLTVVNIYKQ